MKKVLLNVGILFILFSVNLKAQPKDSSENYTPYELMAKDNCS